MKRTRWIAGSLAAAGLLGGTGLWAQSINPEEGAKLPLAFRLSLAESRMRAAAVGVANVEGEPPLAEGFGEATAIYRQAVGDRERTTELVRYALSSYYDLRSGATGAGQVSQAADEAGLKLKLLTVEQNQRIIELLERIAGKEAPKKEGPPAAAKSAP